MQLLNQGVEEKNSKEVLNDVMTQLIGTAKNRMFLKKRMISGLMLAGINGSSILKVHGVESYEGPPALETEKIFKIKFLTQGCRLRSKPVMMTARMTMALNILLTFLFLLVARELASLLMTSC